MAEQNNSPDDNDQQDSFEETPSSEDSNEDQKKCRVFKISETTYKILCLADKKNFDPSVGLENIGQMYLALAGPIDFDQLARDRAKARAKQFDLLN